MQTFYPDQILKKLANLQLAIGLLFLIGLVIAVGTIIEQDQSLSFYQQNYPLNKPILGFLNWKLISFLNLDHIYTSIWFLFLMSIFGMSLLSCTLTVQLPVLRRLRRWIFYENVDKANGIRNMLSLNLSNWSNYQLHNSNYNIFRQGKKIYAYSGLIGRVGPIIVHFSIILLLLGSSLGNLTGYISQEIVPRGEIFHLQNFVKTGTVNNIPQSLSWRVNDFWITYAEKLNTSQFYSDISLLDNYGNELKRKTIYVNEPFIYKDITIYQTDWDIVGLKYKVNNSSIKQLSLKKITKLGQKFWLGSLNLNSELFSVLLNDLSGDVYIYNDNGKLIQSLKIGQNFELSANNFVIFCEFLTSTGLQAKSDPGINSVYFSFFLLIISTYASFITYSQIWGAEKKDNFVLNGKSNRAVLFFQSEFKKILNPSFKK